MAVIVLFSFICMGAECIKIMPCGHHMQFTETVLNIGLVIAIPLQALTGPEGSRRLRLPDFKTIGIEGGKVVSPTHWPPLPPGSIPGTHFC
jgi:hypothetical protein